MSTRTTKLPGIGDIWLVHYTYMTPGNMEKVRPGIIVGFDGDDKVIVQKLTKKKKQIITNYTKKAKDVCIEHNIKNQHTYKKTR